MKTENSPLPADSGLIIGFSGTYYCLWSWWTEKIYTMTGSGNYVASSGYTKYGYIKRISTDLNKVKELYPNLTIDMGLHGQRWERSGNEVKKEALPHDVFPYGFRGVGDKIMESNEVKFLWSLFLSNQFGVGRSKVYARRRLAELGLLVRYKTSKVVKMTTTDENGYVVETGEEFVIRRSYCSPKLVQKVEFEKNAVKGHFFENGKRVKLMLKQVKSFSFDSQYGTCYVVEYMDAENRVFKYKGSTPPEISKEDFEEVQATIKHGEYKGQAETQIQRIKTLSVQY